MSELAVFIEIADEDGVPAGVGIKHLNGHLEILFGVRRRYRADYSSELDPVRFADACLEEDGLSRHNHLRVASYHGPGLVEKHHLDVDWPCVWAAEVDRVNAGDLTDGDAKPAGSQVRFRAGLSRSGCAEREDCDQRERRPQLFDFR